VLEEIKTKIENDKAKKAKLAGVTPSSSSQALKQEPDKLQRDSQEPDSSPPAKTLRQSRSVEAEVQTSGGDVTKVVTEGASISLNINLNIQNDGKPIKSEQPQSEVSGSGGEKQVDVPSNVIGQTDRSAYVGEPMEVEHSGIADQHMETEEVSSSTTVGRSSRGINDFLVLFFCSLLTLNLDGCI